VVRLRLPAVLAVGLVVLIAVAGCARVPSGVDRELVDDWSMMGEAKVPEPAVGACWTSSSSDVFAIMDRPGTVLQTPCDSSHFVETVHVGHFSGALAEVDRAPTLEQLAEQYTICDAELTKFLGAPWTHGRLRVLVMTPTNTQWHGGARFFRCDVAATRTELGVLDPRTETLKGTLAVGGSMLLGCGTRIGAIESWDDITPVACTAPHDAEFVGTAHPAIGSYPADSKATEKAFADPCWAQVRAYTGSSERTLADVGYGYWPLAGEHEWKAGQRDARCYLMLEKRTISRSLRNNAGQAI
jgi:hypothetical protein